MLSSKKPTEELSLRFMQATISQVNKIFTHLHAVEQVLISKGAITQDELLALVKDAERLPIQNLGMETLQEMLSEITKEDSDEKDS